MIVLGSQRSSEDCNPGSWEMGQSVQCNHTLVFGYIYIPFYDASCHIFLNKEGLCDLSLTFQVKSMQMLNSA